MILLDTNVVSELMRPTHRADGPGLTAATRNIPTFANMGMDVVDPRAAE